jgi:hypothetical protein
MLSMNYLPIFDGAKYNKLSIVIEKKRINSFFFQPTCLDGNQCLIEIDPQEGTLYHSKPCLIEITFIAKKCGVLSDDWYLPCYIQNASQPIFLKLNTLMKGMNVEFRHEEK